MMEYVKRVKIDFENGNPSEKTLKAFFGDKNYCGAKHGSIKNLTMVANGAVLEYSHTEDAELVINISLYKWKDGTVLRLSWYNASRVAPNVLSVPQNVSPIAPNVSPVPQKASSVPQNVLLEPPGNNPRRVYLKVPPDIHKDELELYLEAASIDMRLVESGIVIVDFVDEKAARELLRKRSFKIEDKLIYVLSDAKHLVADGAVGGADGDSARTLDTTDSPTMHAVYVKGLTPICAKETIDRLIKKHAVNHRHISYADWNNGIICVLFLDKTAADNFLDKKEISFKGNLLSITKAKNKDTNLPRTIGSKGTASRAKPQDIRSKTPSRTSVAPDRASYSPVTRDRARHPVDTASRIASRSFARTSNTPSRCLLVTNLPKDISRDYVRDFFANKGATGGGPIDSFYYNEEKREAIITYNSVLDAEAVLNRTSLTMKGNRLTVVELDESYTDAKSCAVRVSNLPTPVDEEHLSLFFDNQGASIEDKYISEDSSKAVLAFRSPEDATKVTGNHEFRGKTISVTKLDNAPAPRITHDPVETNKLVLRNVSRKATVDKVKLFLLPVCGCDVRRVIYSSQYAGVVMVIFDKTPDFSPIRDKCLQKPLVNAMISIEKVPVSQSIQIDNIGPHLNEDMFRILLASFVGQKPEISTVKLQHEPQLCAIAEFDGADLPQLIERLSAKKPEWKISVYHKCIGTEPVIPHTNVPSAWLSNANQSSSVQAHSGAQSEPEGELRKHVEQPLTSTSPSKELPKPDKITKVMLDGVNPKTSDFVIKLYLTNSDNAGKNAIIEEIDRSYIATGRLMVMFSDETNAKHLIAKEKLIIEDQEVLVRRYIPDVRPKTKSTIPQTYSSHTSVTFKNDKSIPEVKTIEVTGIPSDQQKEFVKLFVEDEVGPVDTIDYDQEDGRAVITFTDTKDANKILEKELKMENCLLQAAALDDGYTDDVICGIRVSGFPRSVKAKYLELYFKNRKSSGGGPIDNVYMDNEGTYAVLTFNEVEVTSRVLKKTDHRVDSHFLEVHRLSPAVAPPLISGPVEPKLLLLRDLTLNIDADDFKKSFKTITNCDIKELQFSAFNPGVALVEFKKQPDFQVVREFCRHKPVQGKMCSVQKVPESHSLQLYNLGDFTRDHLELFFDSDKVAEDQVVSVNLCDEPVTHALAVFTKESDMKQIITSIRRQQPNLTVLTYHECFGLTPPDTSLDTPDSWVAKTVQVDSPVKEIVDFLNTHKEQQDDINLEMGPINAQVDWPLPNDGKISIAYKPTDPHKAVMTRDWVNKTKQTFARIIENFRSENINTLGDAWTDFVTEATKIYSLNTENVELHFNQDSYNITIVGVKRNVEQLLEKLQEKKKKIEDDLQKKQELITETQLLKYHQLFILKCMKFHEQVQYEHMVIEYKDTARVLVFRGLPNDVTSAKIKMFENINTIVNRIKKLSPTLIRIINFESTKLYLQDIFEKRKIIGCWEVIGEDLGIYSTNHEDLSTVFTIIDQNLIEKSLEMTESQKPVIATTKWQEFVSGQMAGGRVEISTSGSTIHIAGTSDKVNTLYEDIDAFMKDNAVIVKLAEMPRGIVRLLSKEIDSLKATISYPALKVESVIDGTQFGFRITGTFKICKQISDKFETMAKNMKHEILPTSMPGMVDFFITGIGKHILRGFEADHNVAVDAIKEQSSADASNFTTATGADKPRVVYQRKTWYTFKIAKANLPTYKCDAIVNAANESLEHKGGLAQALVKQGGQPIQDECSEHVTRCGPIISPGVFISKPGTLNCSHIIHAVGPKWNGGHDNEENKLYDVISEVLDEAKKLQCKIVALPAISTGIFNFPIDLALKSIIEAIDGFFKENAKTEYPQEVILVDNTKAMVDMMKEVACRTFGDDNSEKIDPSSDKKERDESCGRPRSARARNSSDGAPSDRFSTPVYEGDPPIMRFTARDNFRVEVFHGDIIRQNTDVIVHGTNKEINLGTAVGTALRKAAGKSFTTECKQKGTIKNKVEFTTGGNLKCRCVAHVVCTHHMTDREFKSAIVALLEASSGKGYRSVAFPALGTGNLGKSAEDMSRIFMEAISDYTFKSKGRTNIKLILVVVFDAAMATVFQQKMAALVPNTKICTTKRTPRGSIVRDNDSAERGQGDAPVRVHENLNLVIYGTTDTSIKAVSKKIQETISTQTEDVKIDGERDQINIACLTENQKLRIKNMEHRNQVFIKLHDVGRYKYINIRGFKQNVYAAKSSVEQILHEKSDRERAEYLAKQVQWQYLENEKFVNYEENINEKIEREFINQKPYCEWKELDDSGNRVPVRISFAEEGGTLTGEGKEITQDSDRSPLTVRRIVFDKFSLPDNWSRMDPSERHKMEILNPSSYGYHGISQVFNQQTESKYTIHEIYRVQNPSLYQQVKIMEKQMSRHVTTTPLARKLWHGTSKDTIHKINAHGFDRNYAGSSNAHAYGKGVYFAVDAKYSCQSKYAAVDSDGYRYLYYCTVLTGDYTQGQSKMIDTPVKDPQNPDIKYDSVVNNTNPKKLEMFVIFSDTQAYPEYLIKFK